MAKLWDSNEVLAIEHFKAMARLVQVVQDLSLARQLEAITAIVRVAARELTHADGASFVLRDQDQCFYVDEDAIAPLWKGQRFPMEICIGGWTMNHCQPVIIPDIYGDERIPFSAYQPTFVKSLVMVPIRTIQPIGAIGVYWANLRQPTQSEVDLLQALADTTAVALENVKIYSELEQRVQHRTAELEVANTRLLQEIEERKRAETAVQQLSITDELTGLHNRRGFFLLAEQQLNLAQQLNTTACVLFIDLDGLKSANDHWGHEVGDDMILQTARILSQTFGESDIVARLGGDEFAVFMPNCSGCEDITHRLQTKIDSFNQTSDAPYALSMSIGLSQSQSWGDTETALDQLLAEADQHMYQAKRRKAAAPLISGQSLRATNV